MIRSLSPDNMYQKCLNDPLFRNRMGDYLNSILRTDRNISNYSCIPTDNIKSNLATCEACELICNAKRKSNYDTMLDPDDTDFLHKICHRAYDAINSYQLHVHTPSCMKNGGVTCRYRKPERTFDFDKWEEETANFFLSKNNGMVNNFNIWLSLVVNSNTDVQLLTSGNSGLAIIQYICNYITKNSIGVDNIYMLQKLSLQRTLTNPLICSAGFNEQKTIPEISSSDFLTTCK